jgi:hypothetical protein
VQHQLPILLEQSCLLLLVTEIVEFVAQLRDAFFFEFELASHNLVAISPSGGQCKNWRFSLINQAIPLAYRSDFFIEINQIYNESEYEFNETLIVKKIASFFVTLATGKEPENQGELVKCLQSWHDKTMYNMPKNKELGVLMAVAYKAVQSLHGELIPLSQIANMLMQEHAQLIRDDKRKVSKQVLTILRVLV